MEYLIGIIAAIVITILVSKHINKKKLNADLQKLEDYAAKGFPNFSKTEQLEVIYSDDYSLILDRLGVNSIPNTYLVQLITISKEEMKSYILNTKDILRDKHISLNQYDGYWVDQDGDDYLYQYRERGQIQSTQIFSTKEALVEAFINDMTHLIPKFDEHQT